MVNLIWIAKTRWRGLGPSPEKILKSICVFERSEAFLELYISSLVGEGSGEGVSLAKIMSALRLFWSSKSKSATIITMVGNFSFTVNMSFVHHMERMVCSFFVLRETRCFKWSCFRVTKMKVQCVYDNIDMAFFCRSTDFDRRIIPRNKTCHLAFGTAAIVFL